MKPEAMAAGIHGRGTATVVFKRPKLTCHTCGGTGHFASQCPSETIGGSVSHAAVSAGAFLPESFASFHDGREDVAL